MARLKVYLVWLWLLQKLFGGRARLPGVRPLAWLVYDHRRPGMFIFVAREEGGYLGRVADERKAIYGGTEQTT